RGLIENNELKKLKDLQNPSNTLEVNLVRVIKPEFKNNKYDYSVYNENSSNCLIPLEIIYRNTIPEHSSFRRRAQKGEINIEDYGLEKLPATGTFLEKPILDVSTKLEATDRYISWQEAKSIAALGDEEVDRALALLKKIDRLITEEVKKAGLNNLDGKIELAFDEERNLMVVDALGTPDECRFSYNGFSISKEAIRKYYRDSEWYQEVKKAKEDGNPGWKKAVSNPQPLPSEILELVSQLYMACANEITGRKWFKDVASFDEIKNRLIQIK
ncbi:MAG: phosphoribosylaminoimidazolesuccinocarboxamide synthase, partial [Halanaerobiales bacterium]